jgi:RND family efflux transporter MFP subunit
MRGNLVGSIVAGAALLPLLSCQQSTRAMGERPPTPVHAVPVRLFTPQTGERYSASLTPERQLTMSFRVAGFVESIYGDNQGRRLEPGDTIPAGAALAVLRAKDYDLGVQQAKGQLEAARKTIDASRAMLVGAEAARVKAEATWKRADDLYSSRAITAPDWEAAKAQRDIATAQVASARSQLDSATAQETAASAALATTELAKADSTMTAPWTAQLLERSVEVGSFVSPGQAAFTLADTSSLKAVFGVPDSSAIALKKSDRVPLSVEAVPGQFTARVISIAAAADPATRLFLVEAAVPNPGGMLRPGMIATVYLRTMGAAPPVAVVPLSAIIRSKGEAAGFSLMVVRMNRARSVPVTLATTYGDQIAISGVQPGELVVSSGASLLAEGEPVEVIQ